MIDTANHFLSVSVIKSIIDTMELSRFNVLHWHVIDSYSFPLDIPSQPSLAQSGSWSGQSDTVYAPENVTDVINYAHVRGIRVVPEMEVPGHAYSWGLAFPDIVVQCLDTQGEW